MIQLLQPCVKSQEVMLTLKVKSSINSIIQLTFGLKVFVLKQVIQETDCQIAIPAGGRVNSILSLRFSSPLEVGCICNAEKLNSRQPSTDSSIGKGGKLQSWNPNQWASWSFL